jgi:hypothetical protein
VDVQSGSATGTYSTTNNGSITITQPEYGSGDALTQVLATLSVTTSVPCSIIITAFATGYAQNAASGSSATFGGYVTMSAYLVTSTAFGATNQTTVSSSVGAGAGANAAASGLMKVSDILQIQTAGTWNVELRAAKFTTDMTAIVSNIQFRVEVIKL